MATNTLKKSRQKSARYLLDKAVDHLIQASFLIKESRDPYARDYMTDIDCIADDLSGRISQILIDDLDVPAETIEQALKRAQARDSLKQYLDMVERERSLRDD